MTEALHGEMDEMEPMLQSQAMTTLVQLQVTSMKALLKFQMKRYLVSSTTFLLVNWIDSVAGVRKGYQFLRPGD